ncbi:hypothetical protein C8R31_102508 [Nitrosospira sp. Nsp2]|nr:hypothetical protein C8R31_102508 [Nitrosospira sp. Nsp2]
MDRGQDFTDMTRMHAAASSACKVLKILSNDWLRILC